MSKIQALLFEIAGTRDDISCISDALAATSSLRRFTLPSQRAGDSLLSQVVALPAPGDARPKQAAGLSARRLFW
ncbi:hypothetical protein JQ631_13625 [Bradyrhizobium manausense]|uniref:hypothetical protein n=1 Tax=Bradyrhizobium manausense TaxID=989370 RepID=UPI001BA71BBF|nr:hypothetical protein [Bradyrhizobium manausense]MBR0790111.1 hypothetical protein [Bradyrhizobium manausense]